MNFVAFDFETANRHNHACSLGIAVVESNVIVKTMHWLINPEADFDPFNVSIHHITKEMSPMLRPLESCGARSPNI